MSCRSFEIDWQPAGAHCSCSASCTTVGWLHILQLHAAVLFQHTGLLTLQELYIWVPKLSVT